MTPTPRPSRWREPVEPDATGLFTRADALASGWTDHAIRHAVGTGRWIRVAAGVYAPAPQTTDLAAANLRRGFAGQRRCVRAVLSHATAAVAWGLPAVCDLSRPCLTVPADTVHRALSDVHLHRAGLPASHVRGRCTSPARTVLDIAREHGLDAGLAAADAAVHRGLAGCDDLATVLSFCAGWPGVPAARSVTALVDGRAESPLESLSRLRMTSTGVATPELQVEIGDEFGTFIARVDFYWPEFGVVGEADGNLKYQSRADLIEERRRQRRLETLGLIAVRWEWADLARFGRVTRELQEAFGRGIRPGGGRRWSVLAPRLPANAAR